MAEQQSYVIIGNGITGATAAEILRAEDAAADITVIADDPFPVYYRPALKDYLAGRVREDKLWARPNSFYQQQNIRFLHDRVMRIQAGQHTVQLQSGLEIGYSRLLLANGARASRLTCPGTDLAGAYTLRTVADYQAVLSSLTTARRVVVSGSGTLALETIETLRHRGYHVIHLLRHRTLWSEVLDATASDLVLQQERRDGVEVHLEEEIVEITGKQGQVQGVVTTKGTRIPCEVVIMAIGIEPIIDFVKDSGIPCGRGIKVDGAMRTGAPDIYAAGDVIETTDAMTGRTRVIGQWYPAIQQARAAAYSMLDLLDNQRPFRFATFYNATFLYGLDFASAGLTNIPKQSQGYQEIVADPQPRTYRKVILKDGVAVGVLALGDRKDVLAFKRAIDHGVNLLPVASRLFADDFKLSEWLDKQGVPPAILGVSREGDAAIRQAAYSGAHHPSLIAMAKPQPRTEAFFVPSDDFPTVMSSAASGTGGDALPVLAETRLSNTKVMTVGRQTGVYLLIDHATVSRRHAEISYANGQYILRDLGSANGTYVNDVRLKPGSVHILEPHDEIRFGKVAKFTFQLRAASTGNGSTMQEEARKVGMTALHEMKTGFYDPRAAGHAPPPLGQPILNADGSLLLPGATSALPASEVAKLANSAALIVIAPYSAHTDASAATVRLSVNRVEVAQGIPKLVLLKEGKHFILGRDKKADIVLADVLVSRQHAEVVHGPDGFYIHDLGSSNGVIVNQTRIDNPYLLTHGDRITIGNSTIYFMAAQGPLERQAVMPLSQLPPRGQQPAKNEGTPGSRERGAGPANGAPRANVQQAEKVCHNCGASNQPVARFCTSCGLPL
jgi:NADPH-dependent 2,4-dienoyl-CoA reductase/sulfur reductase-like enzyme/pSer/pThr/pTyr-binding forkhead associated (FHA) protein